jgi:hypothetical protein
MTTPPSICDDVTDAEPQEWEPLPLPRADTPLLPRPPLLLCEAKEYPSLYASLYWSDAAADVCPRPGTPRRAMGAVHRLRDRDVRTRVRDAAQHNINQ